MKIISLIILVLFFSLLSAQDISYNRKIVDTLTSSYFWGRGYTNDGMKKAADFLANECKNIGLLPLDKKGFLQQFAAAPPGGFHAEAVPRRPRDRFGGTGRSGGGSAPASRHRADLGR